MPSITAVVKSWSDCLAERLADDANADWTEQLLETINRDGKSLRARVEVCLDHFFYVRIITSLISNHGI